jgi:hypothetical protein
MAAVSVADVLAVTDAGGGLVSFCAVLPGVKKSPRWLVVLHGVSVGVFDDVPRQKMARSS